MFFLLTANRLRTFVIEVLDDEATHICASVPGQLQSGEIRPIMCMGGAIGSIINIRLTRSEPEVLTLCEVEVFGIRGKAKHRQTHMFFHNHVNQV